MVSLLKSDLQSIRDSVALVGRLSDGLVRLGPLHLCLDGVLSWIPGLGELYSGAAAGFIIVQGVRARVPLATLVLAAALMGGRTLITAIPLAGAAAADLLTAHRWSARLIVAAIDRRIAAGGGKTARASGWRPAFA
jgi:ethanolamine transporter EutH